MADDRAAGETRGEIEDGWNQFLPDQQMQYHFLDQHLDQLYRADQKTGWFK